MKTRIFISLITGAVLCGGLLTGCDKDDDNEGGTSEEFTYDKHSYRIVKQKKTWIEAAADAVAQGGYLAEIDTKGEQEAIWKAISAEGISPDYAKAPDGGDVGYIWIGGHRTSGNAWVWNGGNQSGTFPLFWLGDQKGSAIGGSYANWGGSSKGSLNEPDNFTHSSLSPNGQNTVAIGLASWPSGNTSPYGIAGEWNDIADTNQLYYVIEFD
ncbi:MAG: C-type lectin domain-containing protein [Tannerellaceae bacterium]|jgi:hypothetical protein|nr:C-type lectin domain-containing protein [Tannerellaceae bacterium]